jgi:uncharacterized membrane protein
MPINVFSSKRCQKVELKVVLIASNTAIGGPATVAAFCNHMKTGMDQAATFRGVFGYAIGSMLGIGIFRLVWKKDAVAGGAIY